MCMTSHSTYPDFHIVSNLNRESPDFSMPVTIRIGKKMYQQALFLLKNFS